MVLMDQVKTDVRRVVGSENSNSQKMSWLVLGDCEQWGQDDVWSMRLEHTSFARGGLSPSAASELGLSSFSSVGDEEREAKGIVAR